MSHAHTRAESGESAPFHFETTWRVAEAVEPVWDVLSAIDDWPGWWPGLAWVHAVDGTLAEGSRAQIGVRALGLSLSMMPRIEAIDPPRQVVLSAEGTCAVPGCGRARRSGPLTVIDAVWCVTTTRLAPRLFRRAPVGQDACRGHGRRRDRPAPSPQRAGVGESAADQASIPPASERRRTPSGVPGAAAATAFADRTPRPAVDDDVGGGADHLGEGRPPPVDDDVEGHMDGAGDGLDLPLPLLADIDDDRVGPNARASAMVTSSTAGAEGRRGAAHATATSVRSVTAGRSGSAEKRGVVKVVPSTSVRRSLRMRGSPMPQMSLTASAAIVDPTRPQRTPRTSSLGTGGHRIGVGDVGEEVARHRSVTGHEGAHLALEAEDRPPHERGAGELGGIVGQISGREVVRTVDDEIVGGEELECIVRAQAFREGGHGQMRVEARRAHPWPSLPWGGRRRHRDGGSGAEGSRPRRGRRR